MMQFIEDNQVPCPTCGKHNFHRNPSVQPDVQDLPGCYGGCKEYGISASRNRAGYFRKLQERTANFQKENSRSVSVRSVSPSATKSHPATSPSVPESLSRWSWNSSVSLTPTWNGSHTGNSSASTGCRLWASKPEEMRVRDHDKEELSFYSKATTDIEFLFPFGWGELWGIADRTDYDLTQSCRGIRSGSVLF